MSDTAGAEAPTAVLGLGLDIHESWHRSAAETRRAFVETYLLTRSVRPPPTTGGGRRTRSPGRLPSLGAAAKGPGRQSGMARLSVSEPSLLTPNEVVRFEGFSCTCRPSVLHKRPLPPPPFSKSSTMLTCKTCHPSKTSQLHQHQNHQYVQSCRRPAFIHFSQAIQPISKQRPIRCHSHNPVLTTEVVMGDLQPSVMQHRSSSLQGEPLCVVGKPFLPGCMQRPIVTSVNRPARSQLHVFLPTEAEGEEVDMESVDEGFMDELDCKITSLKLQQRAPKTGT